MTDRFIARQPIFDSRLKVFAYELPFRAGPENFCQPGAARADDVIVNSTMLLDMQQLVGNALAFINVDAAALQREAPRLLSPAKVVIEILETVQPDDKVVEACRALAADQYVLALDDFMDEPKWQPLISTVRYLKVDFRAANHELRRAIAHRYLPLGFICWRKKWKPRANCKKLAISATPIFKATFFASRRLSAAATFPQGAPRACSF